MIKLLIKKYIVNVTMTYILRYTRLLFFYRGCVSDKKYILLLVITTCCGNSGIKNKSSGHTLNIKRMMETVIKMHTDTTSVKIIKRITLTVTG